ncbi:MAG: relaxase/mobilization nuclease domain-containing protein, partial [Parcubacteria group bacterium]|nr:relaxase/mobilization nuclease domain-containing protein [Parcubacteria group bacterium]
KVWGKTDKRQYHHIIQSFLPGEVSAEAAHEVGQKLAVKEFKNFEVLIATHIDRDHYHNHLIVNSVSFIDGRKYKGTRGSLVELKEESDRLCGEYGLYVIEKPFKKVRDTTAERKLRERGIKPWKDELRDYIDDAIKNTNDLSELREYLKFHYGVEVKIQNKNISFRHPDKQKFCRGKKLGIAWNKDFIEKTFKEKRKVIFKKRKCNPNKEKGNFKIKNRIDIFKKGINGIEQDISWDIRKEKFKQEKLKKLEKEKDLEESGINLRDDRGFEK